MSVSYHHKIKRQQQIRERQRANRAARAAEARAQAREDRFVFLSFLDDYTWDAADTPVRSAFRAALARAAA